MSPEVTYWYNRSKSKQLRKTLHKLTMPGFMKIGQAVSALLHVDVQNDDI
jgi:predicted unusual protein kinase regulating ubiquinone biosynthesis (AarF/ABC1/UbiB family)